ncbi:hypothetical protein U0070_025317 [Myodes glareolus]|uniref:Uncharacterized protein n=1 Tax=Myodes glareolus TaxID=447135 RepID=A0AAW0JQ45_MYOGA
MVSIGRRSRLSTKPPILYCIDLQRVERLLVAEGEKLQSHSPCQRGKINRFLICKGDGFPIQATELWNSSGLKIDGTVRCQPAGA